ncbi:MAG: hypothetical protein QGH73_10560 [Rhodospirillales bacterium]|nr:hypothetical protein [Rhodospirillales bacterium]MDP6644306.1 hypothetical protein [Rhodospirillales bacterium]MDP6842110.1 hypothetical protein [Rhodospirillales bacterium]
MALTRSILVSIVGVVAILFAHGAKAEPPQILGLMATATPTPLSCENGTCWAEFSAFCLQRHRKSPHEKTAYVPAAGTNLTLQVTAADGSVRSLDAGLLVSIESERSFVSVRMTVPETLIKEMNGAYAALSVGKLASLVPVKRDGDDPMTAGEIAQYTGPLRAQAELYVQYGSAPAKARLLVAETSLKLFNAVGNTPIGTNVDADALWQKTVGAAPGPNSSAGIKQARRFFNQCHRDGEGDGYMLGMCLQNVHDLNALPLTERVWKGLGAGG